eukprot:Gregarina_sp_Poly_1__4926@NODE_2612_length_1919_cov_82_181965_g1655_i0_p2_GENE_NODE_2612_length_1919_cov_82_181965_g1655_i0NODE_2612_length_1919_cov_82_181965_g1655_i0_p2_ORF_typecomplete_len165_score20_15NOT2_3_5/PF04153_18/0_02_NODE_2612_length_1919_cov_82_181965_g1655_i013951889
MAVVNPRCAKGRWSCLILKIGGANKRSMATEQKVRDAVAGIHNLKKEDVAWLKDNLAIQAFSKDLGTAVTLFENSVSQLPGLDVKQLWTEKKYKQPANAVQPPPGFPLLPLDSYEQPDLFRKFNLDTLMAVFYFPSVRRKQCRYTVVPFVRLRAQGASTWQRVN